MKKLSFTAMALGALCAASVVSANAADIARPAPTYKAPVVVPIYNWSGFYLGGNIGWAFGNSSATYNPTGLTWDLGKNGFMGGGAGRLQLADRQLRVRYRRRIQLDRRQA